MKNALIPLLTAEVGAESVQTCNARELHASLQVGRDFSTWIKGRIDEYSFAENIDFVVFDSPNPGNQKKSRGGDRRSIDYHLTMDMAKELAMLENNDIGRAVRRYFIQAEKELRQRLIADLEDKARHVLALPGIKSLRTGITFKQTVILQKQSRELMRLILEEQAAPARLNLHRQLRQVNDALGIPTDPLADIVGGQRVLEG